MSVQLQPYNGIVAVVAESGETLGIFDLVAGDVPAAALCVWNFLEGARAAAAPPFESLSGLPPPQDNVFDFTRVLALRNRLRARCAAVEILEEADSGA